MSNSNNYYRSLIDQVCIISHKIVESHPKDIKSLNFELYLLLVELSKISQQEGINADDIHCLIKCYIDISIYIQKSKTLLKNNSSKDRISHDTKRYNNNIFILFMISFYLLRYTCIPKGFVHEKSVILLLSNINSVSKLSIIIILKYLVLILDLIISKEIIHRCYYQLLFLLTKDHKIFNEKECRYSYDRKFNEYKDEFEMVRNIFRKNDLHFVISDNQQLRNVLIQIFASNLIFRLTRKCDISSYRVKWFEKLSELRIDSSEELSELYECNILSVLTMFKHYMTDKVNKEENRFPKILYICPDVNWFKDILHIQLKEFNGAHNLFYHVNKHMLPYGDEWQTNFIYHWSKYTISKCQIEYQNQIIEDFDQNKVLLEFRQAITFEDNSYFSIILNGNYNEIERVVQFFKRKSSLFVYSHKQRIEYLKLLVNIIHMNSSYLKIEIIEGPLFESLLKIIDSLLITVIDVKEIYDCLSRLYLYKWNLLKKILNMLYFDAYNRRSQDIFHLLSFMNQLLLDWISSNSINEQNIAVIEKFIEYVDDKSLIFLMKKGDNILIETAIICFFKTVSVMKSKWNIDLFLLPSIKLMSLFMMSNNWISISYICDIIYNYKVQVKLFKRENINRESILLLNRYILTFCNALWRQNLFSSSIEEKSLNIKEIVTLPKFIPEYLKHNANEIFSIKKSIAFMSLCAKFLKFLEISSNVEELNSKLNPNALRDNIKLKFILFLKQKGCSGLYKFIKEFVALSHTN